MGTIYKGLMEWLQQLGVAEDHTTAVLRIGAIVAIILVALFKLESKDVFIKILSAFLSDFEIIS